MSVSYSKLLMIFVSTEIKDILTTRMHSSRIHTVRCCGRLGGGGGAVCLLGGCLPVGGVSACGGVYPGVSAWVSA